MTVRGTGHLKKPATFSNLHYLQIVSTSIHVFQNLKNSFNAERRCWNTRARRRRTYEYFKNFIFLNFHNYFTHSLSLSLSLPLCVCVCVCSIPLSLSLSLTHTHTHKCEIDPLTHLQQQASSWTTIISWRT